MGKRVLLVGDAPVFLRLGEILLARAYEVETSRDAGEALKRLVDFHPQLILVDSVLPDMSGVELGRRLRETAYGRDLPILLLAPAGGRMPYDAERIALERVDSSLKPEQLLAVLEERMRSAEARSQGTAPFISLSPELLTPFFHEFRTSLTMIKTCIALLTNPRISYDPTELREFLDIVRRGGDRVDRLVRDFLTILKLESGVAKREAREVRAPVDVESVVMAVAQSLQPDMAERGVTVHIGIAEDLPPLLVAEEHLHTILEKLLHNAVKFSREAGGEVAVNVRAAEGGVRFEVSDQGIGIPEEEQQRIFDRFYQLTRAGLERQGAGLGLAVAKGLVELYGGSIRVQSQVDTGSTFIVFLPASTVAASEDDIPRTAEEAFRRLGIHF